MGIKIGMVVASDQRKRALAGNWPEKTFLETGIMVQEVNHGLIHLPPTLECQFKSQLLGLKSSFLLMHARGSGNFVQ